MSELNISCVPCEPTMTKEETANMIINTTNGILLELNDVLRLIEDSIHVASLDNGEQKTEVKEQPLLAKLRTQRELASVAIKRAEHIKEGLW